MLEYDSMPRLYSSCKRAWEIFKQKIITQLVLNILFSIPRDVLKRHSFLPRQPSIRTHLFLFQVLTSVLESSKEWLMLLPTFNFQWNLSFSFPLSFEAQLFSFEEFSLPYKCCFLWDLTWFSWTRHLFPILLKTTSTRSLASSN